MQHPLISLFYNQKKNMETKATLAKIKKNLCSKYLLPTIGITHKNSRTIVIRELGFVNAYLEVHAKLENNDLLLKKENCIYMIFNFDELTTSQIETLINSFKLEDSCYNESYQIDGCLYALAYDVLPKWSFILSLFKNGKYSAFGIDYANEFIINQKRDKNFAAEQYKVITRDPSYIQLKSDELVINPSVLCDIDLDEYPTKEDYVFYYQQSEVEPAKNPYILNIEIKGPGLSSLPKDYYSI